MKSLALALAFLLSAALPAQQAPPLAGIAHVAIRVKDLAASRRLLPEARLRPGLRPQARQRHLRVLHQDQRPPVHRALPRHRQGPRPRLPPPLLRRRRPQRHPRRLHRRTASRPRPSARPAPATCSSPCRPRSSPHGPPEHRVHPVHARLAALQRLRQAPRPRPRRRPADRRRARHGRPDVAREFYINQLAFKPLPGEPDGPAPARRLRRPGRDRPSHSLGLQARITLQIRQPQPVPPAAWAASTSTFVKSAEVLTFTDPDGNQILASSKNSLRLP